MKRITCLAMGLAVSVGVLAACTKAPVATAPQVKAPYVTLDVREDIKQDHIRMMQKVAAKLAITDEQKTQFKAIIKNYIPQFMTDEVKENKETIKKLVLAEDVDETALTNALNEHYNDMKAKTNIIVDMMAELRAVLTDEQRTKAIELINAMDDKDADIMAHRLRVKNYLMEDLNLTDEQKASLKTLKDKMKALQARKMEVMKPALASFVETGDKDALLQTIQSLQSELQPPIGEVVDFVNGLSLEQRQMLVNKIEAIKKFMKEKCSATPAPVEEPVVEPSEQPTDLPSAAPSDGATASE